MSATRFFTSLGVALLALGTLPAAADTESALASADPQENGVLVVTDPTGDANFINGQGSTVEGFHEGPDTRPASIDGADIERIWFSTPYETIKTFNADGTVEMVTYEPEAFRVTIQTHGDVLPTFGPSLVFTVPAWDAERSGFPCTYTFQAWIRGSDAPDDHPQRAEELRSGGSECLPGGGQAQVASELYTLAVDGNVIAMEYPLDLLGLPAGTELSWPSATSVCCAGFRSGSRVVSEYPRSGSHGVPTRNYIDETDRIGEFVVGSDVPQPVVCSQQPSHPDCQI